ncbi:MAG: YdbH domain-containing protein [Pontibacterium sp.]
MQRSMVRLLWLLTALTLVVLVSAFALLPWAARHTVGTWLGEQGFTNVTFEMGRPSWNKITIEQLSLKKEDNLEDTTLETGPVVIRYSPLKLLLQQQLDLVEMPGSKLSISYKAVSPESNASRQPDQALDLSAALPSLWLSQLPSDLIRIGELKVHFDYPEDQPDWTLIGSLLVEGQALYSRVQFVRESQDLGWADLELDQNNQLHFRLLYEDEPFLQVDGELSQTDRFRISATHHLDGKGFSRWINELLPEMSQLPAIDGVLTATGVSELPLLAASSPERLLLQLKTAQQLNAQLSTDKLSDTIGQAYAEFEGQLKLNQGNLSLSLFESSQIKLKQLSLPEMDIAGLIVDLQSPLEIEAGLDSLHHPHIQPLALLLTSDSIKYATATVVTRPLLLRLDSVNLAQHSYTGSVATKVINIRLPERVLPELSVKADFNLKKNTLRSGLIVSMVGLPIRLRIKSTTRLLSKNTELEWQADGINLADIEHKLRKYLPELPAELAISTGMLHHSGVVMIQKGSVEARLQNAVGDADITWDKLELNNISWQSTSRFGADGRFTDEGQLNIGNLQAGINVADITSAYRYEYADAKGEAVNTISLASTKARVLEGIIEIAGFSTPIGTPKVDTSVSVTDLDLDALVSLERQQGLSGKGKLSGEFPLYYDAQGLKIANGSLYGLAPGGEIRFQPDTAVQQYAASNAGLSMALNALENFKYDTLDIKLDYTPSGIAYLRTRLKGHNPDWNNGHPVDFSINIEEDVPSLIKTLQFTDELTEKLEKRYRE